MKYKVGDKVRIRRDLRIHTYYGDCMFVSEMNDYKGSVVTISKVFPTYYCIEEDIGTWIWTDEMFEGLADDELTAEEAIKIQAEMCRSISNCKDCPICKEKMVIVAIFLKRNILNELLKFSNSGRKTMRRKK